MAQDTRNGANKAGASFVSGLWDLIHFGKDVVQEAGKWLVRAGTWAASFVWDAAAIGTDFVTWAGAEIGNIWSELAFGERGGLQGTNFSDSDGFLDKVDKSAHEGLDKALPITSKWGKTKAGEWALGIVSGAAEILAPGLGIFKGLKIASKAAWVLRKSPKAIEELQALAKLGKKIDQSQVDEIVKKYAANPAILDKAMESTKIPKVLEKMIKSKTPEEIEKMLYKYPKLSKIWNGIKGTATVWTIGVWVTHDFDKSGISLPGEDTLGDELEKEEQSIGSTPVEKFRWYDLSKNTDGSVSFLSKEKGRVGLMKKFGSIDEAKAYINKMNIWNKDVATVADVKKSVFTPEEEKVAAKKLEDLQKNDPELDILATVELYMKDNHYDVSQEGLKKMAEKLGIPNFTGNSQVQNYELFRRIREENDTLNSMSS